jgi:sulfatase maturation enzyme AslB (radical SAM superfamily)
MQGNSAQRIELPTTINPSLIKLIKNLSSTNKELTIIFSGGESLLYIDKIKDIVKAVKSYNIKFNLETNGLLLNDETVSFLNKNNINVFVGWDGRNSKYIRGSNIFDVINLKQSIFKINNLNIEALITSSSYPLELCEDLQEIVDEYKLSNPKKEMSVNISIVFDTCIINREIINLDYNKIRNDIINILNDINKDDNKNSVKSIFVEKYVNMIIDNQDKSIINIGYNSSRVLYSDLIGNLHPTTSLIHTVGNIDNMSISDYIVATSKYHINNNINNNADCTNCEAIKICNNRNRLGRIPLIGGDKHITCKFLKTIYPLIYQYYIENKDKCCN